MITIQAHWVEDSNAYIMAYLRNAAGTALKVADIASLTYSVYQVVDGVATVVTGHDGVSLTIATAIFDTLQTAALDPRWTGSGGYNFKHDLLYTAFPSGNVHYEYECTVIETGGARYPIVAVGPCQSLLRT